MPQEDIYDESESVQLAIQSELSAENGASIKTLLPTSPLFSGGLSGGGSADKSIETTVRTLNVQAKVFLPGIISEREYMSGVLKNPHVIAHVQSCLFSKPLYMVFGVATGSQYDVEEARSQEYNAEFSAVPGVPQAGLAIEASALHGRTAFAGLGMTLKGGVDFAYRIKEFTYSKIRKRLSDGRYHTAGALYGRDDQIEANDHELAVFVPEFEGFEEEEDINHEETVLVVDGKSAQLP